MSDLFFVHVVQAEEDLLDHFGGYRLRYFLHLHHFVEHVSARDQLRDNIVILFVFKQRIHLRDVGVISVLQHFKLVHHELFVDGSLTHLCLFHDLDGAGRFCLAVNTTPDSSKGTLAQLLRLLVFIRHLVNSLETTERLQVQHPLMVFLDLSTVKVHMTRDDLLHIHICAEQ